MLKLRLVAIVLFAVLILAGCAPEPGVDQPPATDPLPSPTATQATQILTPTKTEAPLTLDEVAEQVINALAVKDLAAVGEFAHPEQGVRFSPYTYVEESHLVFSADELTGLAGSDQVFLWGYFDGTGDPIELNFDDYYERFVYSADFANPEAMAVDEELGYSSMINNITAFYPGSSFVEYHFSGFEEEFGGMDWVSLRLVFIQEGETWYLVGIVHDQWTI